MENTMKFKTNLSCNGCVASLRPKMQEEKKIESWEMDLENEDKILTVHGDLTASEVLEILDGVGFKGEKI